MHVAVGSENPVKRRATERVFATATVESRAVDSGVSEQPVGHPETIVGAKTRARSAFGPDVAFGVGLEGGVAEISSRAGDRPYDEVATDVEGLFLIMWAAVTDGRRVEIGAGPSVRLPDPIAREIVAGRELGPVLDEHLGTDGIARREGAIGVFTDGRVDREGALADAVACAAGHLRSG
ncbi:MAG: inosine/xanthosine triphosphatase [Halalkalicoccus sp.]